MVQSRNKTLIIMFIMVLFLILPFYNYFFIESMGTAHDRENYLYMMRNPFDGREEPLIHIISMMLDFLFEDKVFKLIVIQNVFFILLIYILSKYYDISSSSGFVKLIFSIPLIIAVYSNMLGVQLRIGYAVIIYLALILPRLSNGFTLKRCWLLFIPILMHLGTFFCVIFYLFFAFFKINNFYKSLKIIFFTCVFLTLLLEFFPLMLNFLGFDAYYLLYFDSSNEINSGREYPLTLFFYILVLFFLFLTYKNEKNESYYYCYSGLVLVYLAVILEFYISYKFLLPISIYAFIFFIKSLNIKETDYFIYAFFSLFLFFLAFLFFSSQVGLI